MHYFITILHKIHCIIYIVNFAYTEVILFTQLSVAEDPVVYTLYMLQMVSGVGDTRGSGEDFELVAR